MLPLFLLFATSALAADAVVTRPVVNLFSAPTADVDVVSQAILGTHVAILESKDGWVRVQTPDEYKGWVQGPALITSDQRDPEGRWVEVKNLQAHLYREASITKHAPVMTVPFETRLEVIEAAEANGAGGARNQHYLQVRLPDGRRAFVQKGDVAEPGPALTVEEMIALSRRFLELPYTWGGTSSFGYDCSGFTQMLYRRRGLLMPRDAQDQANWKGLAPVAKEELQAGDLLYFGRSAEKITHTGLYIGNGEFIHATAHENPVIQVSKLVDEYWTRLLVAQRRPVTVVTQSAMNRETQR
jgi:cell wall-associated NlpC family hydrolase